MGEPIEWEYMEILMWCLVVLVLLAWMGCFILLYKLLSKDEENENI